MNRGNDSIEDDGNGFQGFVGKSNTARGLIGLVKKVSWTSAPVLINGESGTGKELIARIIHEKGMRAGKQFVAVNCGAIPETLLESMLFGHQRGAFTGASTTTRGFFEEADGGTLFLDEITETTHKFQVSLLRVLQERDFIRIGDTKKIKTDFRLISATNKDIEDEVRKGRFREDLFYRLNVIAIHIPPLRERREDIAPIANCILRKLCLKYNKNVEGFEASAMDILQSADLKGNVRELHNIIERILTLKSEGFIQINDLPTYIAKKNETTMHKRINDHSELFTQPFKEAKASFEKKYIDNLLSQTGGNIAIAARLSGIKKQNLYSKAKKLGFR